MEQWKIEQVSLAGYSFRVENDEFVFVGDIPSQSELDAIFEKYDAKKYQRDRNYPDIGEQLDMLWHAIDNGEILGDKSCNFFKTLKKVKDDNPKPE